MARSAPAAAEPGFPGRDPWRNLKNADFALALAAPVRGKSAHFLLHHLAASPLSSARRPKVALPPELSTAAAPNGSFDVDNTSVPHHWWLGLVIPKRHARRAVTRTQLRREMRAQAAGHRGRLPPGQWVIRLRAPFDPARYPSAASAQLRESARQELEQVFASAVTA